MYVYLISIFILILEIGCSREFDCFNLVNFTIIEILVVLIILVKVRKDFFKVIFFVIYFRFLGK